ncbi:MAG TPA: hypothetical protein VGQ13_04005 [Nitrososphaera sp.]|jgi:hypothetical protein|nr:hypothetical protein [Nitrososphaera sp.]
MVHNTDNIVFSTRGVRPPKVKRVKEQDDKIAIFTEMLSQHNNDSELDEAIIDVISLTGMIDESTPLHVRFLLHMIALEELLIGDGPKENIQYKIAERVTLLLASRASYILDYSGSRTFTRSSTPRREIDERIQLNKKIKDLYGKRSTFAHSGTRGSDEPISEDDYRVAVFILHEIINKFLFLRGLGIKGIRKNPKAGSKLDNTSLDGYIEKLKYHSDFVTFHD